MMEPSKKMSGADGGSGHEVIGARLPYAPPSVKRLMGTNRDTGIGTYPGAAEGVQVTVTNVTRTGSAS